MNDIIDYKRFENETDEELIYRVTGEKDKIGSWQDVADILNELLGTEYTESKFRKQRQAFDKLLAANRSKFVDGDAQLTELDKKLEDIRKERIKLQTANIERGRVDRSESRQEMYYEYIGSVINTLPLPDFKPLNKCDFKEALNYIVGLADVHYGATFVSTNNDYSPEMAEKRFRLLAVKLIQFIKEKGLESITIVSLGDLIQGAIRLNDLKINDSSVVKATVEVCRLVAQLLTTISEYANVEYYHVPSANHTQIRTLGAKANELADEDLEYLMGHYISDLCRDNSRIHAHLAEEGMDFCNIELSGNNILALHGHQIKNLDNAVKDISLLHHVFYDAVIIGHVHNGQEIPSMQKLYGNMELLCCPSFVGSDPYSDKIYKGCSPSVKIFGFSAAYGHTETYNLFLS